MTTHPHVIVDGEYAESGSVGKDSSISAGMRERHNSTTLDEQVEYLEEQLSVLESQGRRCKKREEGGRER